MDELHQAVNAQDMQQMNIHIHIPDRLQTWLKMITQSISYQGGRDKIATDVNLNPNKKDMW